MLVDDTIAALATPPAASARAIIRTSGALAVVIATQLQVLQSSRTSTPSPGTPGEGGGEGLYRRLQHPADADQNGPHPNPLPAYRERGPDAVRVMLRLADDIEDVGLDIPATLLIFPAPRSSTGEDVVEYHLPGSPFLVGRLLERLFALGARQAEPGEFTARAFFHGKLDLAAAEGVVATIAASNRAELDAARQLLAGELARRLAAPMEMLARTLALVEVGIDFSEEEVTFIARDEVIAAIAKIDAALRTLIEGSTRCDRLAHEPRIVFAGRPNAGKSTLLNALAGVDRAVISAAAGTTRDAISAPIHLKRGRVLLIDVAGLDADREDDRTSDEIEKQMRDAAHRAIETADIVIRVIDAMDARPPIDLPREPDLTVQTKADLTSASAFAPGEPKLIVRAVAGTGLDALRDALDALAFATAPAEASSTLALNARHVAELTATRVSIARASVAIDSGPEFVAFELRAALNHLGRILGTVSPDDVLGRIFSSFCIGK